jgi:hypothetical protein
VFVAFCAGKLSLAAAVLDVNKHRKMGAKTNVQKRPRRSTHVEPTSRRESSESDAEEV